MNASKKAQTALVLAVLLIVSFSASMALPKTSAQTSSSLVVKSYSWYIAPTDETQTVAQYGGDLIAVGEVQNTGSTTIPSASVLATALNSAGSSLAIGSGIVYATNLAPQQKAPFYIEFIPQNSATQDQTWESSTANITFTVNTSNNLPTGQTPYSGVTIPKNTLAASDSTGTYTISGTIQNTGNQRAGTTWVIATFYNSTGSVIAVSYPTPVTTSLSVGASTTFTATPADDVSQISSQIATYSVVPQAYLYTGKSSTPPPATESSTTSTPTSGSTQTAQPAAGLTYPIIGGIAAAIVIIALVVFLFLRRKPKTTAKQLSPLPPPPPPP